MGGTRERRFAGTNFKPRKLPENAATPTRRVHALLGCGLLEEQVTGEFNVQPTTPIVNIGYSDEESFELNSRYSANWSGYGVYSQGNP